MQPRKSRYCVIQIVDARVLDARKQSLGEEAQKFEVGRRNNAMISKSLKTSYFWCISMSHNIDTRCFYQTFNLFCSEL